MKSIIFIVVVAFLALARGCLITNCPRGGKRADSALAFVENSLRECTSCGRDDLGRCFGPHICCGPTIGCFIGSPETFKCRKESLYSKPCIAGFSMCRGNRARCALDGICCSQDSCHVDSTCKLEEDVDRKNGAELNAIFSEGIASTNERMIF